MTVIDNWLARQPLESMAEMPEMLIVGSLEDAARLRQRYSPLQRLVVFFPGLVSFYHQRGAPLEYLGQGIRGIRVESKRLSANIARLYFRGSSSPELAQRALQDLDNEIRVASARCADEMDRLCQSAQGFDVEPSQASLGDFVRQIISSQFEFPEVLISEAVQNADGSSDKKLENRIDVVLDAASRTITVSDQGCGMNPEVVESAFFNLYASLNEHLDYAAGRFGLGTASFFGADHEQVVLDTRTRDGTGAYVVVDSDLNREPDQPPRRLQPGTTLSIKLKVSSPINFVRLESILRADCAYLGTPIFLHQEGNTEQINIELLPRESAETERIEEPQVQGHLRRCEGPGVLHILCHRIRLSTIATVGYSGAINCSALETTVSRDSVMDNPVLRHALEVVRLRAERLLKPTTMDVAALSVRSRARLYRMFVMTHLLQDGIANEPFCRQNYQELVQWQDRGWNHKSLISGALCTALSSPLIVACSIWTSTSVSATLEALRTIFLASSRGIRALAAPPMFLLAYVIAAICYAIGALHYGVVSGNSLDKLALYGFLATWALLPVWALEIFFWHILEIVPHKVAKWAFHRALRKDGDWFRRPAPRSGMLKNVASLALVLLALWVAASELSSLVSSGSLFPLLRSVVAAGVQAIKTLGLDLERIPWTWPGGALVGASALLAFKKRRFHRKLQFSRTPLSADQHALIDRIQEFVGANVPVGYSRRLTPADAKTYFVGKRICLNPYRSLDLNAQQIAFSYDVKARRDYPPGIEGGAPMSQFAFRVSWQDLIRKIGYRYEHPADYVSSLIGKFYDPGARVDITVDPSKIEVKSDSPIDASLFDQALKGSPLDSTFVIPPVTRYATVRILSGRRGIVVDAQRTIHRADPDEYYYGTIITILRDQKAREDGRRQGSEYADVGGRLERLYWGSDLRVTVNGRALYTQTHAFKTGIIEGAVSYDATHEGGIHYYAQGRFIEREPFIDGIDVLVQRHPFRTTIASSHLIKSGEEQLQIQSQLPDIMAGYLESPQILELARRNPHSARVLCQTILARFPEDEHLRSLADRLAHPEEAQGLDLVSPVAGGSTRRLAPAKTGLSLGRLPASVKVIIFCTLAALCLGVWRHSEVDRSLPGAQTAPQSVALRGDRGSSSPSNPGRPAPGPAPGDGAPASLPNPEPPVPASVGPPENSAGAEIPDRIGQSSTTPPGVRVDQQSSERTGGSFTTPPGDRVSGPLPGLAYRTSSQLAEDVRRLEDEAEKRGTSLEGYVPESAFNVLTMSDGHLEWNDRPPHDTLVDNVRYAVRSNEFAHVSGHADGIRAVRSYLTGFLYGAIPPAARRRYPDDLSAMLGERRVDCTASNTLAAHLLNELGYRKVVAVAGTRGGCSHMWLSVWEDGQWRIEDFTPSRMSPDFARACAANSVSASVVLGSQHPSDGPAPQARAEWRNSPWLTSASGTRDSSPAPADQLTLVIFLDLCILLALVCIPYSMLSLVLRKRANAAVVATDNGAAAAETVRDLLGVAAVKTGSEATYNRRTHTLTLHVADLSGAGPFVSAVKAVPLVSRDEAQQQALYRRLADRALR